VGVCFTLLLLGLAVYTTIFFAADHELDGSTWPIVAWIAMFGAISGLAATYLGRRVIREHRSAS
jgi:hypothetical protein